MKDVIPAEMIEKKISLIRGQKVMLDRDLAELYGVDTKMLVRAVRRHIERFPGDFMTQRTKEGFENVRCHFGTSRWGGRRHLPYAFTENGVAMLSTYVLLSKKDGRMYTGYTSDLRKRFAAHDAGNVLATRNRGPFELV